MAIEYITAGESHGKLLVGVIKNIPAGLTVDADFVDNELKRRMSGYGRSARMTIEAERAEFVTGIISHKSIGSPIAVLIRNKDNRSDDNTELSGVRPTAVRPGHADLSGAFKYGFSDVAPVAERASARSTAVTVALGAVAKLYLKRLGIEISSHTIAVGGIKVRAQSCADINACADADPMRCLDGAASKQMAAEVERARQNGDTLGGATEITARGCISGIGSYVSADKRIDGIIMREIGAIPSVKAVEIGDGFAGSATVGSAFHDEIRIRKDGSVYRDTNRAGGIEGGMTNGQDVVVRAYFKPVPTLAHGLRAVDIASGENSIAASPRSDVCVVPAGGVVCEAALALALASAISEMLGGDTMDETVARYNAKRSAV